MSDISLIAPAPPVAAKPERVAPTATQVDKPAAAARPANAPDTDNITNKSKVKTELRSAHAFTYTFFDAKTLEVIGRWPQTPVYRMQGAHVPLGAAVETVV